MRVRGQTTTLGLALGSAPKRGTLNDFLFIGVMSVFAAVRGVHEARGEVEDRGKDYITFNVYCGVSYRKQVEPSVAFWRSCDVNRYFGYICFNKVCVE